MVADGGADLEHFELRTFEEVRSILLQASGQAARGGAGEAAAAGLCVGVTTPSCHTLLSDETPVSQPPWLHPKLPSPLHPTDGAGGGGG